MARSNNDNIGHGVAQNLIHDLLDGARQRKEAPPHSSHCPDHNFQQDVNYAMLVALYVLLCQPKQVMLATIPISVLTSSIVAGVIIGFGKLFGVTM